MVLLCILRIPRICLRNRRDLASSNVPCTGDAKRCCPSRHSAHMDERQRLYMCFAPIDMTAREAWIGSFQVVQSSRETKYLSLLPQRLLSCPYLAYRHACQPGLLARCLHFLFSISFSPGTCSLADRADIRSDKTAVVQLWQFLWGSFAQLFYARVVPHQPELPPSRRRQPFLSPGKDAYG